MGIQNKNGEGDLLFFCCVVLDMLLKMPIFAIVRNVFFHF